MLVVHNFGSLSNWTAPICLFGNSPFLLCGAVHLDGSKNIYMYCPNGQHISVNLDQPPIVQSKITFAGCNFELSKITIVCCNFGPSKSPVAEHNFGPFKITALDHNFGPSKTTVVDPNFVLSKIRIVCRYFGPSKSTALLSRIEGGFQPKK